MRFPTTSAQWRAVSAYDGAPPGDRLHVRVRWLTCPFPALEREVPLAGDVVEVGCGHGLLSLYLAACSPARRVVGVDVDAAKLDLARAAAATAGLPVMFRLVGGRRDDGDGVEHDGGDGGERGVLDSSVSAGVDRGRGASEPDLVDAVVVADVLYLLPVAAREALLDEWAARLRPGGRLVLKEADRRPRWKGALTVAQELVSTRVLRITEGDEVAFAAPDTYADRLRWAGLDVSVRRVDAGYVHPHVLIVGAAPGATVRP